MKLFVLDSSSLVRAPEILSRAGDTVHFVIPSGIVHELERGEKIPALVKKAVSIGAASFQDTVSSGDQAVLEAARKLQAEGKDIVIVSEDRIIGLAAAHLGIEAKRSFEFLSALQGSVVDQELAQGARNAAGSAIRKILFEALTGFALSLAANFIWENLSVILESFNVWGTLLSILIAGVLLYCLRARFRLTYAVLEFVIGFATAASVFYPDFDFKSLDALALLRILGGLYVMVRGQDNLSKALEGTRFEYDWKRFSGESRARNDSRPTQGLKRTPDGAA